MSKLYSTIVSRCIYTLGVLLIVGWIYLLSVVYRSVEEKQHNCEVSRQGRSVYE